MPFFPSSDTDTARAMERLLFIRRAQLPDSFPTPLHGLFCHLSVLRLK